MLRIIAVLLACALMSGCASLGGNALYTYTRTGPTSCTLVVDSGRQLPGGFDVEITEGCGIRGTVPVANQGGAALTVDQLMSLAALLGVKAPAQTIPALAPVTTETKQ